MSHIYYESTADLADWIRREVELGEPLAEGSQGSGARRVQEWLTLHDIDVAIDGDYGPATAQAVAEFQQLNGLEATGAVDEDTFATLVAPMVDVLRQRLDQCIDVGTAIVDYAQAHLDVHPREVGGANRGPWVRLYMGGNEGSSFAWCAGFVTFLVEQATQSLQVDKPIEGSVSCDALAAQGGDTGLFVAEGDVVPGSLPAGSIFLVRKTDTDWTHTGVVTAAYDDSFDTIEGNTNDDGDREGYEVCARTRSYTSVDFILPAPVYTAF